MAVMGYKSSTIVTNNMFLNYITRKFIRTEAELFYLLMDFDVNSLQELLILRILNCCVFKKKKKKKKKKKNTHTYAHTQFCLKYKKSKQDYK